MGGWELLVGGGGGGGADVYMHARVGLFVFYASVWVRVHIVIGYMSGYVPVCVW